MQHVAVAGCVVRKAFRMRNIGAQIPIGLRRVIGFVVFKFGAQGYLLIDAK
jgi:hypothetical protein